MGALYMYTQILCITLLGGVCSQYKFPAVALLAHRGVASFSDGPSNNATGRLFFYMTPMDETTQLFSVSERMGNSQVSAARLPGTSSGLPWNG
jgi:hypothetical protein